MLFMPRVPFTPLKNPFAHLFIHSTSTYGAYLALDTVLSAKNKSQTCPLTSWSLFLVTGQT